nr:hypothetical protein [Galactobacter valiniphilus]
MTLQLPRVSVVPSTVRSNAAVVPVSSAGRRSSKRSPAVASDGSAHVAVKLSVSYWWTWAAGLLFDFTPVKASTSVA